MRLNAPSFVTFFLSLIIMLAVVIDHFGIYPIPVIGDGISQFLTLLIAYVILMLGNIIRGI